ncbi:MAG TPA: transposase [Opitutaceae bacterium]|nr:transposase [Opitutaceae bacterium]
MREPKRDQFEMQVFDLDGLIDEDHPARVIWAYACKVDMSAFEAAVRSREGVAGAPQTSPHLLLALWLYATKDGIGSARALAQACVTVSAYRWLCGGIGVSHRILSEFRNDQAAHIEELLIEHVASLSLAKLIDLGEVAQDGVRIRASAGSSSFRRRSTLEKELAKAQARLKELARQGDDDTGPGGPPAGPGGTPRQIRAAKEREARVGKALEALADLEKLREQRAKTHAKQTARQKEPRASTTDPEARVMKMPDGGFRPAYNVQFASLPENGIVLAVDCSTVGSDGGLAEPMADRLHKAYGSRPARHLVDGGYQSGPDIAAAEAAGTDFYCPVGKTKTGEDAYGPRDKDTAPVARWRAKMATDAAKEIYKRRSRCELVHAKLRNVGCDKLHVRGREKVETWMRWYALASNILIGHNLATA